MTLPDFDANGNLPPGTYVATVSEVIDRYSKSSLRRRELSAELESFYELIKPLALDIYLVGSYITKKLRPGDVDFFVILPDDWVDRRLDIAQQIFHYQDPLHQSDVHVIFVPVSRRKKIRERFRFFRHSRAGDRKGIIKLEESDD